MLRVWRLVRVAAAVVLVASGCGGDGGGGSGSGSSGDSVSAVLGIITTNIEADTGDGFVEASEGEELVVGDRVKTDSTGFGEVTYHDGSWMRVESEATLTIEELADSDERRVVSTSIDTGEAWNRVAELVGAEDEFVVDTPVATAAVRGTAFSIECDGGTACTFSVVEGEVLVTPGTGDPVPLTAGQSLTVTAGEEPPAPEQRGVEVLSAEPFIAKNLELDESKGTEGGDDTGDGAEDDQSADQEDGDGEGVGSIAGSYSGLQTFQTVEYAPDAIVPPGNPGVGDDYPIEFQLTGPCSDGSACALTFTSPGAPSEQLVLDVSGDRVSGSSTVTVTREFPPCSWSEEYSVTFTVDGDRLTGTTSLDPESLNVGCARPVRSTSQFEADRR